MLPPDAAARPPAGAMTVIALALVSSSGCAGVVGDTPGGRPPATEDPNVDLVPDPDPEVEAIDPLVRRLTVDELVYTLSDTFGVTLPRTTLQALPVDRPLAGFVNTAAGQTAGPEHALAYDLVATSVVREPAFQTFLAERLDCADPSAGCGASLVEILGEALFRRPVGDRELTDFVALFEGVAGIDGAGFADARDAVARAMLQSPQFLYRIELEVADVEGTRRVGGYEMASRLSFLLWASAPDEALLEAARSGRLDAVGGILDQVDRMLADTGKTRRVLERFLVDWGRLENLPDDDGLRDDLVRTAAGFYVDHVDRGAPLLDVFVANRAVLTPALAEAYGIPAGGPGPRVYDLGEVPGRVGLLAQPGVLAGMTNADGGAIVARGLFLLGQVFCGDVPDPPASLQEEIDAFVEELPEDASDRLVAETRLERRTCAQCHQAFDPLAYAFEQFDHRGGFRTADEHGNVVRTDGWFPAGLADDAGDVPGYVGLDDYVGVLRGSPRAGRCFVRRQVEYALGARLGPGQDVNVEAIRAALEADDGTWEAMVRLLVTDDLFRTMPVRRDG